MIVLSKIIDGAFWFVWCPNAKENETRNLANLGGLRARLSLKQTISDYNDDDEECRPWRRRLFMAFTWGSALRITLLLLLLAAVVVACFTLPVEKVLFFSSGSVLVSLFDRSFGLSNCLLFYVLWFFELGFLCLCRIGWIVFFFLKGGELLIGSLLSLEWFL